MCCCSFFLFIGYILTKKITDQNFPLNLWILIFFQLRSFGMSSIIIDILDFVFIYYFTYFFQIWYSCLHVPSVQQNRAVRGQIWSTLHFFKSHSFVISPSDICSQEILSNIWDTLIIIICTCTSVCTSIFVKNVCLWAYIYYSFCTCV